MTNISLREIVKENWRVVARLSDQLSEEHRRYVAHNAISMLDYHHDQETLGQKAIYVDDTPVGYTLYGIDEQDAATWWIIRLMIAPAFQRLGYGRTAMQQIITMLRAMPGCRSIRISFVPANTGARALYEQLGFKDTGIVEDGELVFRLDLD
jgi:diamine N-acetyltransferase